MGVATHQLVPTAILFDNPQGLTKEEFIHALARVRVSPSTKFKSEDPWDVFSTNDVSREIFLGSKGMAKALKLRESQKFEDFQRHTLDSRGLVLNGPRSVDIIGSDNTEKKFIVVHERNEDGKAPDPERRVFGTEEEVINSIFGYHEMKDLVHEDIRNSRDGRAGGLLRVNYVFRGISVDAIFRVETYKDEKLFWQQWPLFHPDNYYNFDQSEGYFNVFPGWKKFCWYFEGGRYFFDPTTLDLIPASWRADNWKSFGFTDLVVTSEAIKYRAWKLFSGRGFDFVEDFLRDFPQSRERLEGAIWDSHMYISAKERGLTNFDEIRERITPRNSMGGREREI